LRLTIRSGVLYKAGMRVITEHSFVTWVAELTWCCSNISYLHASHVGAAGVVFRGVCFHKKTWKNDRTWEEYVLSRR